MPAYTALLKSLLLILILFFTTLHVSAQTDSSVQEPDNAEAPVEKVEHKKPKKVKRRIEIDSPQIQSSPVDTISPAPDSTITPASSPSAGGPPESPVVREKAVVKRPIDSFYIKMLDNPFLRSKAKPMFLVISERQRESKDDVFYLLSGLLFFLAFIKLVFSRYFANIFKLFFQPTFRQKQTREQLSQNTLPSLLLNLFFVFSAAAYVSFLFNYYNLINEDFKLLMVYSTVTLLILYTFKYIFLSFAGWVFDVKETTDTYVFIVYLINKILGVILIPFTLIIAFSNSSIIDLTVTISVILIIIFYIYRYLISLGQLRRDIKMTPLHFLLYVCAFEVTPLLLIYKTLSIYLNRTA